MGPPSPCPPVRKAVMYNKGYSDGRGNTPAMYSLCEDDEDPQAKDMVDEEEESLNEESDNEPHIKKAMKFSMVNLQDHIERVLAEG